MTRRTNIVLLFCCALLCLLSFSHSTTPLNFVNSVYFGSSDFSSNVLTDVETSSTSGVTVVTGNILSKQMVVLPEFQGVNLPVQHQNLTRRGMIDGFVGILDSKWNVFTHVYKVFSTTSNKSSVKVAHVQIDTPSVNQVDLYITGTLSYGASVTAYFSPSKSISITCKEQTSTFVAKISDAKNNWFQHPITSDPVAFFDWILITETSSGYSSVNPTGLLLKSDTKQSIVALFNFFEAFNTTTYYFDRAGGNIIAQNGMFNAHQNEMESAMLRLSTLTGNMEALALLLGNGYDQTMNLVSSKSAASMFTSVFTFSTNITIVQYSPATFAEISRDTLTTEEMYSYSFLLEMDWNFRLLWSKGIRQYLPDYIRGGMIDVSDHYIVFPISFTANSQPLIIEGNAIPYYGEQDAVILLFDSNTRNLVNVKHIGSPAADSISQAKLMTSSSNKGKLYFIGSTGGNIDFGNQIAVSSQNTFPTSFLLVLDTNLKALNVSVPVALSYTTFTQIHQLSEYELLLLGLTDTTQLNFQSKIQGGFLSFYGIYPTVYQSRRFDNKLIASWDSLEVDGTSVSQFEMTHSADPAQTSRQTPVLVTAGNFSLASYASNGVYYIRLRPVPSALTANTPFSAPIPIYTCPFNYEGSVCQFPKCFSIAADLSNTCNAVGVCYDVNTCYCGSRYKGKDCGDFKDSPVFKPNVLNDTVQVQTSGTGTVEKQVEIPILSFSNDTKTFISEAILTFDNQTVIVGQGSSLEIEVNSQDMNVESWNGVTFNRATYTVKASGSDNVIGVVVGNGFQVKTGFSVLNANLCITKSLNPTTASQYTVPGFAKLDSSAVNTYRHAPSLKVTEEKTSGQTKYCARISTNEMYFPALIAAPPTPTGKAVTYSISVALFVLSLLVCF